MSKYHKIQTLYKRETEKPCNIIIGDYTCPEFEYLQHLDWVWTEKIDGTNIRVIWDGTKVRFQGKTDNSQIPATLVEKLIDMFPNVLMSTAFPEFVPEKEGDSIILYGEGYGAGIQKGGVYMPKSVSFIMFDIKIGPWWLKRDAKEDIANRLGIQLVPIRYKCSIPQAVELVKHGFNSICAYDPNYIAEGLVGVPEVELFNRKGERIITKLKYKDFAFLRNKSINFHRC